MDHTAAAPLCAACHRPLPAWDLPRVACAGCQQRTADRLRDLPGLYAQLDPRPGRGAPLVGSRHAAAGGRSPARLDVVDLTGARGGVLPVLVGWMRVWAEDGGGELPDWPAGEQQQVAAACRWLRWRLDWACRQHEAAGEAVDEIAAAHRQVRAAATGDRGERRVTVQCGCGGQMRVTVSTSGTTCPGCGHRYGREHLLALPLAARAAAA